MLPTLAPRMVIDPEAETLPDVTVTPTVPAVFPAVKVAFATPETVVAVGEMEPRALLLTAKVTAVPSATTAPAASLTVADTVAVPSALSPLDGVIDTTMEAGGFAGVTPPPPEPALLAAEPGGSSVIEESEQPPPLK